MSAQLFVVATPIGHLDDMTYRAIDVLKSVKIIAAEDTRTSAQLLKHFNIQTPLTACHDHNESNNIDILIQRLLKGEDMALSVMQERLLSVIQVLNWFVRHKSIISV